MKTFIILSLLYHLMVVIGRPNNFERTSLQIESTVKATAFLHARQIKSTAENDTENGLLGPCKSITVVYARGTGEGGNVGEGKNSPGPAWFSEMRKMMGENNITIQGVNYDSSLEGYLMGGDPQGSQNFYDLTEQAAAKCPNTRIVLGGYSQGAQLAHNAAKRYSSGLMSRVAAAVMFSDPYSRQSLGNIPSEKIMSVCHDGDIGCRDITNFAHRPTPHSSYNQDAYEATIFVRSRLSHY